MRHLKQKWKSEKIFSMGLPFVWGARYFLSPKLVCHFLSFECASPNVLAERKNRAEAVLSLPPSNLWMTSKHGDTSHKSIITPWCVTHRVSTYNESTISIFHLKKWEIDWSSRGSVIFPPISLLHPISIPESFVRQLCWGIPNEWRRLSELESYCCTSPFPSDRLYLLRPCVM